MSRKIQIARRHELAAEHRRAEAQLLAEKSPTPKGGMRPQAYADLMFLVGYHTIQADLWRKSHKEFGG